MVKTNYLNKKSNLIVFKKGILKHFNFYGGLFLKFIKFKSMILPT